VPEEQVYRVPALELPDPARRTTVARLRRTEAVRLFVDRARAARPDFDLSETNAEWVVQLCVRLDGLPLALELAAARCNLLSPRELLERLDSSFDLLRAVPGSGLTERQRTLRAAIEWSYELLDPGQQQLFTNLSVFVGGFTLGAAELVAEQPDLDILEGVEALLRNNLLTTEPAGGNEPRLGMLESIRRYALERLLARGDGDAVRRRHAGFCLVSAEEAEPGLWGPQQREWLERLDAERDNIRAALAWAVEAGEAEVGLRIGSALWRYWQMRSHEQEARERLEELLALGSGSPSTRAKAQTMVGNLSLVLGDPESARRELEESLRVHRRQGDDGLVAFAVGLLGTVALIAGDADTALALSREAHEVARRAGHSYVESAALWQVGACLAARGAFDEAERTLEEAISLERKHGNTRSVGLWLKTLAGVAIMRGDQARARGLFNESLAIHRSLDDAYGVSHSLTNLSLLALEAGDAETAGKLLSEALAIERDSDRGPRLASTLEMSARLAAADAQAALAIRLYARAALLRERVGHLQFDLGWPDPTPDLDDLRSRVGEDTFEKERERGRAMTLLEAIDQASDEQRELEPHTM
jgi:predicted ATPase